MDGSISDVVSPDAVDLAGVCTKKERGVHFKVSSLILASSASDTCHDDWMSLTWA